MTLRVKLLRADYSGCGFYRIEEPARVVNESDLGVEVVIQDFLDAETDKDGFPVAIHEDSDVVVFQRPLNKLLAACIPVLQRQGIKCVVEIDDIFAYIDPSHVGYKNSHPKYSPDINYNHLNKACMLADWITVSTPALAQYHGTHGRVSVIRNRVPKAFTELPYQGKYDVGYTGTLATHAGDFDVVSNVLADTNFHVIGNSQGVQKVLSLEEKPTESGWLPMDEYYEAITTLKVGIAPLKTSKFNDCKSNLKILEYSAASVPFVGSPSPEYKKFVEECGGFIATKPREWDKKTHKLIENEDFARTLGEELRDQVKRKWVVENYPHLWVDAWTQALNNGR